MTRKLVINTFMLNQTTGVLSVMVVELTVTKLVHFTLLLMEKGGGDFFMPNLLWIKR